MRQRYSWVRVIGRATLAGLAVSFITACATAPEPVASARPVVDLPSPYVPADWPLFDEAVSVPAAHAAVSSVHPAASEVGAIIMRKGGNAVDAAVAVGFALAVLHPSAGNIGGGGFMVIRLANGEAYTIDYREKAPGRATRDMYLDSLGKLTDRSRVGHLAAGVPGAVAGLTEAQARFGSLSLAELMEPAIRLARDGFVLDERRVRSIESAADRMRLFPASRKQFLMPDGSVPAPGHLLRQSDLARTLQAIADSGARSFYEGYVADLIVAEMERGRGLISHEDLAAYRAIWRDPIVIEYRGYTIYSMPPASSGGVTMGEILNILEGFEEIPPYGSAQQVHLLAEAMQRAFVDRNHYLGDPAFVEMPIDLLLSKSYAAELRRGIQPDRATPTPSLRPGMREGDHTTHYSVVDPEGNAVSVTTTINSGYGSKVTVTGGGFLLNNEMDDFTVRAGPAQPVRAHPGRRQRHRARQADALGHDAFHRARPERRADDGDRDAWRSHHHHDGEPGDLQCRGPRDDAGRGDLGPAGAPPGAARRDLLREWRPAARCDRAPGSDGPQDERAARVPGRGGRDHPHRNRLGGGGRPALGWRIGGVLADRHPLTARGRASAGVLGGTPADSLLAQCN